MIYHSIFTSHVSETNFVLRTISPTKISNFSTFSTCVVMQTFLQWAWNKVVVHEDDAGLMSVSAPHLGLDTPNIRTQAKKNGWRPVGFNRKICFDIHIYLCFEISVQKDKNLISNSTIQKSVDYGRSSSNYYFLFIIPFGLIT